ncbi:hypothetical protein COLO4_13818 [Corchorus olitorius]|uniref:F-box domain-containing protein n=1 Tax=Corchorus olitorius TaxID=93759 RepID=A0A1R3JUS5_9ROSI|nr:hypothetical protein COLO4_13818 [Corchorus olitorius]
MAKFARKLTPHSFNKQKGELHDADGDRISALPDEVLVAILSRIPMEEAVRSSVLSRRWKKLWTLCSRLDLDASKRLLKLLKQRKAVIEREMNSEKIWVRICKNLSHMERIDYINWVNHILESCSHNNNLQAMDEFKVRFDLNDSYRDDIDGWVRFAFERKVKRFELFLSNEMLESIFPKENRYHVSDQVVENFISNCPFLESLCVVASESLIHPRVAGPKIEISFDNIPNLVELYIGMEELPYLARKYLPLLPTSNCFSQLQKLALGIRYPNFKACPCLIRLALELHYICGRRKAKKPKKCPHHSLKLVEVNGFVGTGIDIELCGYLIKNAIMLDKIIINPCHLLYKGTEDETDPDLVQGQKAARQCAERFRIARVELDSNFSNLFLCPKERKEEEHYYADYSKLDDMGMGSMFLISLISFS